MDDRGLLTVFIKPKILDSLKSLPEPDLSRITFVAPDPLAAVSVEQPGVDSVVNRNNGARAAAPTLRDPNSTDMAPYIKEAALLPGEGATVVLRVEVLETGKPGRIEVDASSGSRRIDQAAINYARTQRWYAGRANGIPHAMWIRWGVRLQA